MSLNKKNFLLGLYVAISVLAYLFAINFYTVKYQYETPDFPLEPCQPEQEVDFSELKPLTTTLSKEDVIDTYRTVISSWEEENETIKFINPFAHPVLPKTSIRSYTNYDYETLPEELLDRFPETYKFVFWEDIYKDNKISCNFEFITLTKPIVFNNGSVIISIQSYYASRYSAGVEYRLIKTPENTWTITDSSLKYVYE